MECAPKLRRNTHSLFCHYGYILKDPRLGSAGWDRTPCTEDTRPVGEGSGDEQFSYLVVLGGSWRWWGGCFLLPLGIAIVRRCVCGGVAAISSRCRSSCHSYRSRPGNRNGGSCWGIGSGDCVGSYRGLMDSVAGHCRRMRVGYTRSWLLATRWSRRTNIIQLIKSLGASATSIKSALSGNLLMDCKNPSILFEFNLPINIIFVVIHFSLLNLSTLDNYTSCFRSQIRSQSRDDRLG